MAKEICAIITVVLMKALNAFLVSIHMVRVMLGDGGAGYRL